MWLSNDNDSADLNSPFHLSTLLQPLILLTTISFEKFLIPFTATLNSLSICISKGLLLGPLKET